jgi:DNA-directed RNA polymerase subunit RPC12/RpoP
VPRAYRYVGPPEVLAQVRAETQGRPIATHADLESWLASCGDEDPFTFVIDVDGVLRLASRRSEHVVCAGGEEVLAAGEIAFAGDGGGWVVSEVSNQSTGYCPDPDCWPAVADALDRAGVPHPGEFTAPLVFRRCPACAQRNLVKDADYVCAVCGAELPEEWNF